MIHPILTYPDPRLKLRSHPVETFDATLHTLLDDMYETMMEAGGIGLAAIQIGEPQAVLIINLVNDEGLQDKGDLLEIINPQILESADKQKYSEGCLSLPHYYEDVIRAEKVVVAYQARHGADHRIEAHGLLAVALQHEMDHLKGTLFFERLSILKRRKFDKEYATATTKPRKKGPRGHDTLGDTQQS